MSSHYKIAVPITSNDPTTARRHIDLAKDQGAQIIELRIDSMVAKGLTADTLPGQYVNYAKSSGLEVIATCRHKDHAPPGQGFNGSENVRRSLLDEALRAGVNYVDVELNTYDNTDMLTPNELTISPSQTLITSIHDFKETPRHIEKIPGLMGAILQLDGVKEAGILKIATMANSYYDTVRMLGLVTGFSGSLVGLTMGPLGIDSRILGPIYGAPFTFARLDDDLGSAPGQPTVTQLKRAWALREELLS